MHYNLQDRHMTGCKVLHPAIDLSLSFYKVSQLAFTVLVLSWSFHQSNNLGLLFTAYALLVWMYKLTWN